MGRWGVNLSMNGKLSICMSGTLMGVNLFFIILHLCSKTFIDFLWSIKVSSICPSSLSN